VLAKDLNRSKENSISSQWAKITTRLDGLAHHGVLAHQHDGQTTQAGTDVLHLLGAHVVGAHNEALGELVEEFLEKGLTRISWATLGRGGGGTYHNLDEVLSLPCCLVLPNHFDCVLGTRRVNLRTARDAISISRYQGTTRK